MAGWTWPWIVGITLLCYPDAGAQAPEGLPSPALLSVYLKTRETTRQAGPANGQPSQSKEPFFCRQEHKRNQGRTLPLYVRLGDLDHANRLEGKHRHDALSVPPVRRGIEREVYLP